MDSTFTCHWDESGVDPGTTTRSKSDRDVFMVAGYVAHVREWELLEDRWLTVLDDYGLTKTGFHMVSFFNHHRPYSDLTQDRYDNLIYSLIEIILDHPRFYVSWSLSTSDYMDVVKSRHLLEEDIVRAYRILANRCIQVVSDVARAAGHQNKILHIFHHGNSAWPSFEASFTDELLAALNILRPISQSHTDVISLQAADILVHQLARKKVKQLENSAETKRVYVDDLMWKPGLSLHMEKGELLNAYLDEMYLEEHKGSNGLVRAFRHPMPAQMKQRSQEMFVGPEEYLFNDRLRKIREGNGSNIEG